MHASTPSMNATGTHGPSSAKNGFDRGQRHPVCQRHAQLLFRPTKHSERRRCLHAAVIFQSRDVFSSGSSRNVKQNQQASSGKFEDTGKRPSNEALSDPEVFGGNTLWDMPAATQRLAAAALGRLSSEGPVNWGTAGTNEDLLLNLILFGKFTTYAGCQRSTYDGVSCTSERSSLLARRAVQIQIGPFTHVLIRGGTPFHLHFVAWVTTFTMLSRSFVTVWVMCAVHHLLCPNGPLRVVLPS